MKRMSLTPAAILTIVAGTALGQSLDPFPASYELINLFPFTGGSGSRGFVLTGASAFEYSGVSVSFAGDVNGDGFDDMVIGASGANIFGFPDAGASYVVFGSDTVGAGGLLNLSLLNGSNGFVIAGVGSYDYSGMSVSNAGDINGDGFDDLLIGSRAAVANTSSANGQSYVVFGARNVGSGGVMTLSSLNGTNGFVIDDIQASNFTGVEMASAGDINNDGFSDIVVGAFIARANGNFAAGKSYVIFGSTSVGTGGVIKTSSLNGSSGFVINGIDTNDRSGAAVAGAGDVNGDGIDDLIIGAYFADPNGANSGASYVVFGSNSIGASGALELLNLNAPEGFVIRGINAGDRSGRSVSSAGDVNGDGIDDLVIGADGADPNGALNAGESYVIFGAAGLGAGGFLELSSLNGTNGFVIRGIDAADISGISVASAGDLNGDQFDDILIGASFAAPSRRTGAGETYVVYGAPDVGSVGVIELASLDGSNGFVLNGFGFFDASGSSVSSAGDLNGDGLDDLLIGARNADPYGRQSAGESYVVFGRSVAPPPCLGNANDDQLVSLGDLFSVINNWLADYTPSTGPGDANHDSVVDFDDITAVLSNWMVVCP